MKKILRLVSCLTVVTLSSCAPAVFKSFDSAGKPVDITGTWEGFAEIKSLTVVSQYGSNDVPVTEKLQKSYQIKLKLFIEKGKAEEEIIGLATHLYPDGLGDFNKVDIGKLIVSGSPDDSVLKYSKQTNSDSESVEIKGRFSGNEFNGNMFLYRDIKVTTNFPNGSKEVSKQSNNFIYLVKLLKRN
jgi:hypothetical protein